MANLGAIARPDKLGSFSGVRPGVYGLGRCKPVKPYSNLVNADWAWTHPPGSGGNNVMIPRPVGDLTNKLMIAVIRALGAGTTITPPSGWTLLDTSTSIGPSSNDKAWTYYRVAGSSESPSGWTWVLSAGGSYNNGVLFVYSINNPASPIDVSAFASSTSLSPPQVTTTQANDQILNFIVGQVTNVVTDSIGAPSGEAQVFQFRDQSLQYVWEAAKGAKATAGTTSIGSWNVSAGSFPYNMYKGTIAVVAAPAVNVDSGTATFRFTPSASEGFTKTDSVTASLTFTPDGYESGRDSGSIYLDLQPSTAVEARTITDAATVPVGFLVSAADIYLPGLPAAEDIGTIFLDLQPSGIVIVEYIDAGFYSLKFTVATAHECVTALRPIFEAAASNMYESVATTNYRAEVTNMYVGELVAIEAAVVC